MLKDLIILELENALEQKNIDLKIVRFLTDSELNNFKDYNGKRFAYQFLPIENNNNIRHFSTNSRYYTYAGNPFNVKFYINGELQEATPYFLSNLLVGVINNVKDTLNGQVLKFETAYTDNDNNTFLDTAHALVDKSVSNILLIDHILEKLNDLSGRRSWVREHVIRYAIDLYRDFLNYENIQNERDFGLGLLFMGFGKNFTDAKNITLKIETFKLDTALTFKDLKNIDWAKTNSENHNRVYVIRGDNYYGSFDVDTETAYNNFFRCEKTNFITTRLSNWYNERKREFIDHDMVCLTQYALNNFTNKCAKCNRFTFETMDNSLCKHCLDTANRWGINPNIFKLKTYDINSYSHSQDIDFFLEDNESANPLFLGVELEVDTDGRPEENECGCEDEDCDVCNDYENRDSVNHDYNVDIVLHTLNGYTTDFSIAKNDGSLNSGFEIVSQPATLKAHLSGKYCDWSNTFKVLKRLDYRSHDAETCGLHVHINRNFFGDNRTTQNYNGAKIVYLLEAYWDKFVQFSRRSKYHVQRWAKIQDTKNDFDNHKVKSPMTLRDAFRKNYDLGNKYVALNTLHYNTFEFRIFRGTLNENTFKATLQLVDNLARLVKKTPLSKLTSITFDDIINFKKHPELISYWDLRNRNGEDND